MAFTAGAAAIVTRDEDLEPKLAVPVRGRAWASRSTSRRCCCELEDVYWSEEGILSVQIALAVAALLAAVALAGRFLRRGEQVVLEREAAPAAR